MMTLMMVHNMYMCCSPFDHNIGLCRFLLLFLHFRLYHVCAWTSYIHRHVYNMHVYVLLGSMMDGTTYTSTSHMRHVTPSCTLVIVSHAIRRQAWRYDDSTCILNTCTCRMGVNPCFARLSDASHTCMHMSQQLRLTSLHMFTRIMYGATCTSHDIRPT